MLVDIVTKAPKYDWMPKDNKKKTTDNKHESDINENHRQPYIGKIRR